MTSKPTYEELETRIKTLEGQARELNCLFGISRLVDRPGISLEEVLQGIVDLVPQACHDPENARARIVLEDRQFTSPNFKEAACKQTRPIVVHDKPQGTLEVICLGDEPGSDESSFLTQEGRLIDAVAERLGKIVERKRARIVLRESEKRFRTLVENSLTGILIIQDNQVVYKNPEQERLAGPHHRSNALLCFDDIHPDDVAGVSQDLQKVMSGEAQTVDMDFRLRPGDARDGERVVKWAHCRASLIEFEGRNAVLVNAMDISRTKELEQLLRIQDKMTSLGRVAAGIAHEIRNPLSGINIYLSTLEKIYDKPEKVESVSRILTQLHSASNKIESVIRRVMDFAKPSPPNLVLTDINPPIKDAVSLSSVTLKKRGVEIQEVLTQGLPRCRIDPQLIEQVILNMVVNAAEAMRNTGDPRRIAVFSGAEDDRIFVRISDSGPGIAENLREKIFDPFYTTKEGSSGIGLSLARRIISDHGGTVSVETSKWGGAEFVIEIPAWQETKQT